MLESQNLIMFFYHTDNQKKYHSIEHFSEHKNNLENFADMAVIMQISLISKVDYNNFFYVNIASSKFILDNKAVANLYQRKTPCPEFCFLIHKN